MTYWADRRTTAAGSPPNGDTVSDPSAAMDAALVDARFARPAHHVADEGQVLTLTADGTVSQAPVPVGDAE